MGTKFVIQHKFMLKFFETNLDQLSRGENAYTSGHVKSMTFSSEVQPAHIRGVVQASMKSSVTYEVQISYDIHEGVKHAHCTCPRGLAECHHMAALLWMARYNVSITDKEKQWGVPKKSAGETTQTVEEMSGKTVHYQATKSKVPEETIKEVQKIFGPTNIVGYSWLLKAEPTEESRTLVPSILDILFSEAYLSASNSTQYFIEKCKVTSEQIIEIANITKGQHMNEDWMVTRKHRLTASKFGAVLQACLKNKYPPSLFKTIVEGYNLTKVMAVQWGKNNEGTAKKCFEQTTTFTVNETGLWLHECGFLGASPDGLVNDDAILEVKCPYRYRNKATVKEALADGKYFLKFDGDDNVIIDSKHIYYDQIQGQLHLTGRDKCYFLVWLPIDHLIVAIEKDMEWQTNVDILKDFYLNKFIPYILNH